MPIAATNTINNSSNSPKNTRLRINRRVKFITSHRPMKKLAMGLRRGRGGGFMDAPDGACCKAGYA
ncbi:hypothetical protein D3C81_1253740 [compost metagenome]